MRILIVTAKYYPEPFTISRIAERLAQMNNSVTVLTGRPNYGKWKIYDGYENITREIVNGVNIIRAKEKARKKGTLGILVNYWSLYSSFKKELKKLDGTNFDIVFSHVLSPIFAIDGVADFCKKYSLPHFHYGFDLWPESLVATNYCKRNSFIFKRVKKYSKKIYSSCDTIGFVSPSGIDYIKNYLKVDVPLVRVPQPCLSNLPPIETVSNHTYRADGKTHILFCGTVALFNHLDLIIDALQDENIKEKMVFDVVGSGSDLERIIKRCNKFNVHNVVFHGRVNIEETAKFFKEADILFVPLYNNSYTSKMIPQKLIEYLMYSRPILGMITGDGRDILNKASNLNFICEQDVDHIKESLNKIIETDEKLFIECGRQNRYYFENSKEYSLDYVCNQMNEIMNGLIKK